MRHACPACGQGALTLSSSRLVAALRLAFALALLGFGAFGLWQSWAWLQAAQADSLRWLLRLGLAVLFAGIAVVPVALGLALAWRAPDYRCGHCARGFRRSWLGGWDALGG